MQWIEATECLTSRWVWEEEPISIWPVQRAKGQCGDFKPKVYHHAGTTYSGHSNLLWGYRHVIYPRLNQHARNVAKASIPWNTGSSNVLHWQLVTLLHLFVSTDVSLNQLSLEPAKSITLAKKSLWGSLGMYASILQQQQQSQLEGIREMEKGGDRDRGKGRGWRKAAPVHSLLGYQSHKCRRALLPMPIELVFSLFLVC